MIKVKLETGKHAVWLTARRTIDGKIMVFDHPHIHIVIDPYEKKLITFPKDEIDDTMYQHQDELLSYFVKKGIIDPDKIMGGNAFFSLEGTYQEPKDDVNVTHIILLTLSDFIKGKKEDWDMEEEYFEDQEDELVEPDEEHSTELGEVPHEKKKGTLSPEIGIKRYLAGFPIY